MNDKNEKIKVVAYVRYSSHAQDDGNSVAAQTACISEYAESHNMEIEHWYIDMAKTGRNTKRPEYQRMKQDIENGNVEGKIILVRAIDRLHRNAKNQLVDAEWCRKLGVRIIGITDGIDTDAPNGKFAMTIKAATAEEYSDIIAINTRAGQLKRMNDVTFYALQQCLFSPGNKDKILSYMNNQLKLKAHQRSAEVAEIKDKIDKLSKAQDNLLGMLEDGRASDTIMNRIASNESELAALTEQLESKSKEVAAVDDEMYNELVNRFVSYMGSNMTPQALDLRNAAIDHIEVDGELTTIYFNSGIGIDAATKEYFDNEKDWGASK